MVLEDTLQANTGERYYPPVNSECYNARLGEHPRRGGGKNQKAGGWEECLLGDTSVYGTAVVLMNLL